MLSLFPNFQRKNNNPHTIDIQTYVYVSIIFFSEVLRIDEILYCFRNCFFEKRPDFREKIRPKSFAFVLRWCHLELNQGHTDFQSVALPTELWHLVF